MYIRIYRYRVKELRVNLCGYRYLGQRCAAKLVPFGRPPQFRMRRHSPIYIYNYVYKYNYIHI